MSETQPTKRRPSRYGLTIRDHLVNLYLSGADRDQLDPILDACVATYKAELDEDGQVEFIRKRKGIHPSLRVHLFNPSLHERGLGKAFHLVKFFDTEAARPTR